MIDNVHWAFVEELGRGCLRSKFYGSVLGRLEDHQVSSEG